MIQQPELGKRISDLRKAKGLTQEELVEKCNLSVRTLQRIEAGEVTPRPITIKLIFEALDVSFDKTMNDKGLILKWLEQFYIGFIDLFNLKTDTMKKISILTTIAVTVVIGIFLINDNSSAQNKKTGYSGHFINGNHKLNLTCDGMWVDNNEIIGRDVKFIYEGVKISLKIVKLNKLSMEFNSTVMKGIIQHNKVNVVIQKNVVDAHMITYSAEYLEKDGENIFLKGNAKVVSSQNDIIEADEIVLSMVSSLYN